MKKQARVLISKGLVCLTGAFVVCVILFYFMASLISQDPDLSQKEEVPSLIEFIQQKPRTTLSERKRKLPKKPRKQKKIPKMQLDPTPLALSSSSHFKFNMADFSEALKDGLSTGTVSQSLTPLIRIEPIYPPQAALQGIEGYATLTFDVSSQGTTINIRVVDARPPRVFDQVSIRAVRKWKYSPQMEDGKPTITRGQKNRFEFTLDN